MKIVNIYKENLPQVKLVGKCYTNADRDANGTFAAYWQQAFHEGWFDTLGQQKGIPDISNHYLGCIRTVDSTENDFEYWIGLFLAPDALIPEGFVSVDIPAGEAGICWLCGDGQSGELFSMEASDMCMKAIADKGWHFSESGWFFERYACGRYTNPDENGNVILDIGAYLTN